MRKKLPATLVLTLILTLCLSISSSAFAAVGIIQSEDSEKVNIDITFYNNGDTSITARPIPVLYTESGQIAGICPGSLTTLNPGDSITQQYSIVLREKMVYKTLKLFMIQATTMAPSFTITEFNPEISIITVPLAGKIEEDHI